jgi:hypothetical protein
MAKTTLDTIDELLEGVLDETDGSEIHYKLRSARQLVEVVKQRQKNLVDKGILDEVDDDQLLDDLRELGYIE